MAFPFSASSRCPQAVLFVGPHSVEWLERVEGGIRRHARIDLSAASPELLVRATLEARRAAQSEASAVVLAVSHPLAFHKLVTLPPLSRKDLAQVLRRRATALAGETRHFYFAAREMERGSRDPDRDDPQCTWLLAGVRGGARDLRLLLRDQGLQVRRVVSAELAALEWGRQHAPSPEQAAILIVVGETAVSVALTCGARLCYQESIEGDLSSRPALATGLIHEIKTCVAYWKKRSRGQTLGQVVVVGLSKSRVDLLALTLASILPGATTTSVATEASDPSGRLGLLEAPLASGPLDPELTFWLPSRARQVGLVAAFVATAALGTTYFHLDGAIQRVEEVKAEVGALRRGTADLEGLRALHQETDARIERVERYVQRRLAIAQHGLPMERILAGVLAAFAGRAELDELSVQPVADEPTRVTILGHCERDPGALVARLRAVLDELEKSSPLTQLSLILPEDFKDESTRGAAFTIEARLEG